MRSLSAGIGLVAGFAASAALGPAAAQDTTLVYAPGVSAALQNAHVRVRAPRFLPHRFRATFLAADSARLTVLLVGQKAPAVIPLSAVERLQVRTRKGHRLRGAAIGAVAGYAAGYLVLLQGANTLLSAEPDPDDVWLFYLPCGALAGGVAGALLARERWRNVPVREEAPRLPI